MQSLAFLFLSLFGLIAAGDHFPGFKYLIDYHSAPAHGKYSGYGYGGNSYGHRQGGYGSGYGSGYENNYGYGYGAPSHYGGERLPFFPHGGFFGKHNFGYGSPY